MGKFYLDCLLLEDAFVETKVLQVVVLDLLKLVLSDHCARLSLQESADTTLNVNDRLDRVGFVS